MSIKIRILIRRNKNIEESGGSDTEIVRSYDFPCKPAIGESIRCFDEEDKWIDLKIENIKWDATDRDKEAIMFIEGTPV